MSKPSKTHKSPIPEDSPYAWFREMVSAVELGYYAEAAQAQRELLRLGWYVTRKQGHRTTESGS